MATLISGDPKDRKTFSLGENYWTDEHNRNWTETVDQLNRVDNELSTAQSDISTLQSDLTNVDSRVTTLEGAGHSTTDQVFSYVEATSIAKLTADAVAGDKTLEVDATEMPLSNGDYIILYDAENATRLGNVEVTSNLSEGASGLVLDVTSIPNDAGAGTYVVPDLSTLATADLSSLESRVTTAEGTISDIEAYVNAQEDGSLQLSIENLEAQQSSLSALINQESSRISAVASRLTSAEDKISLSVTDYGITDQPIGQLDSNISGSVTSIDLRNVNVLNTIRSEDKILIGGEDQEPIFLDVASDTEVNDDGTATVSLPNSQTLELSAGKDVYLAPLSSRSAVQVLQGEVDLRVEEDNVVSALTVSLNNIEVDSQLLKSNSFDPSVGTMTDSNNEYTLINPSEVSNTTGWALTNGGDLAASNAFIRGDIEATNAYVSGLLEMGTDGRMVDTDGRYRIDPNGFAVAASGSNDFTLNQMFSVVDGNGDTIGRLSGKVKNRNLMQLVSTGELNIQSELQATLNSLTGDVKISPSPDSFLRLMAPQIKAEGLREHSGVSDAESAGITNNELWVDTSDGGTVKRYYDGANDNGVTNAAAEFNVQKVGLWVRATDSSTVDDGYVDQVDWAFLDSNGDTAASTTDATIFNHTFNSYQTVTVEQTVTFNDGTTKTDSETFDLVEPEVDPGPIEGPNCDERSQFVCVE